MSGILSVLDELTGEPKAFLAELFRNAPVWVLDECKVVDLEEGTIFVREKEEVNNVYILVRGIVKACDFRILGIEYEFCHYEAIEILGGMELFVDSPGYMTTLITDTDCQFIVISKEKFAEWLKNDCNALWMHTRTMTTYLLNETRKERAYLFLQGIDRVYLFFENLYRKNAVNGKLSIRLVRQQISDETGLSVKTINRSLKQMSEEGMLTIKGRLISVTQEQYEMMREQTEEKIDL